MEKPISQNAIGRALDLSSAAMVKLKKAGCPMDSVEAARAWRETNQSIAQSKPDPVKIAPHRPPQHNGDTGDLPCDESHNRARTRREIAEANIAELKEAELQSSLIRVDAVRTAWATKLTGARDALLQIPSRLAPVLAAESDLVRVTALLEDELRQALAELSAEAG